MRIKYRVAGYVKLAKLWERSSEEAICYHHDYYRNKYENDERMQLVEGLRWYGFWLIA